MKSTLKPRSPSNFQEFIEGLRRRKKYLNDRGIDLNIPRRRTRANLSEVELEPEEEEVTV